MAESSAHPITTDDLAAHLGKVNEHMETINRGGMARPSLFELVKDIGGDEQMMAPEVQNTMKALRDGFSLYYEVHAILEDKVESINDGVTESEKKEFMGAYAMFAASSFISHRLNLQLGGEEPFPMPRQENYFKLDLGKDHTLNGVLARFYGLINMGKRNKVLKEGKDLPKGSLDFYRFLHDSAIEHKAGLNLCLMACSSAVGSLVAAHHCICPT